MSMNKREQKKLLTAISIIVGTCVGIGFLSMPYIASQTGYLMLIGYLFLFATIMLFINLYYGEILLRTKKPHQLSGFAERYIGKKGKYIMEIAISFAVYSAIIAYIFGLGESLSYLILGTTDHAVFVGTIFALFMSYILWGGFNSLKKGEKIGVGAIFFLFFITLFTRFQDITLSNLTYIEPSLFYLPIGVILFSLIEFYSLPEVREVLRGHEHLMKPAIMIGTFIPVIFYSIFSLIVVGTYGKETPEIATFALGTIFILIGAIAMFTSYLALGTAMKRNLTYDLGLHKFTAWFLVSIVPIILFLISNFLDIGLTDILSLGGTIAGGTMVILLLIINKSAERIGNRRPEYIIGLSKMLVYVLSTIFIIGMILNLANIG